MSYCCSTCGNLDRRGAFQAISDLAAAGGWDLVADVLKTAAADPDVQAAAAVHYAAMAVKQAELDARHLADEERRRIKRQNKRTKYLFKPPKAENLVSEIFQMPIDFSAE